MIRHLWEEDLEQHWWRMIDFVEHVGRNGVVLNFDKFQFAQREIDFAGFRITETTVKPLDKFLQAIADFPNNFRQEQKPHQNRVRFYYNSHSYR